MSDDVKQLNKILDTLKEMPLGRIFLFIGVFFLAFSFIQYDDKLIISKNINYISLYIGLSFILMFIITCIFSIFKQVSSQRITVRGKKIKTKNVEILLQIGNIEDKTLYTDNSVIVLPSNTKFDDDCITDSKSALGSFFRTHYADKIDIAKTTITETARIEYKYITNDNFELGSTIILPEPFNNITTVAISAVTTRLQRTGFTTDLRAISLIIKNIFELTSDKRIDTIIIPVLGSGHGGLDINFAINFILLNVRYNIQQHHHIKNVKIIIFNEDKKPKKIKLINWKLL